MRISLFLWPVLVLTVIAVAGISATFSLNSLAIGASALFFFYPDKFASWCLALAMAIFAFTLPHLPALLAASTLLLLPALSLWFNPDRHPHVKLLLGAVMVAMFAGMMALQSEAKLGGSPSTLALQMLALVGLWLAIRYWPGYQPPHRGAWLLLPVLVAVSGWPAALWSATTVMIIWLLQWVRFTPQFARSRHLALHLIPSIPFLVITWITPGQLTLSLLVAWATMLAAIWVGEYLLLEEPDDQ